MNRQLAGAFTTRRRFPAIALAAAPERAQFRAIAAARQAAKSLANAAGTRIVGIWELNEGEIKGTVAEWIDVPKTARAEIPREVDLVSTRITIVYEMAPGHLPPARKP